MFVFLYILEKGLFKFFTRRTAQFLEFYISNKIWNIPSMINNTHGWYAACLDTKKTKMSALY